MKNIQPESPELRSLKAKAIAEMDKPLLSKIREVEGSEFILVETFYELLKASSFECTIPIIVSSELEELMKKNMSGGV